MEGISKEELRDLHDIAVRCKDLMRAQLLTDVIHECKELQEPWTPIETASKDGRRYLLFNIFWEAPCTGSFNGRQWVLHSDLPPFKNQPTHYQELPIHKPEPQK